jgi:hypothetical protein
MRRQIVTTAPKTIYEINLWYEAYFGKTMEVEADNLMEACHYAMKFADDYCDWEDTLVCSTHWIESVDRDVGAVPVECSAAAIRCGGAVLVAYRLQEALRSLVAACEREPKALRALRIDVERAKTVLMGVPDRIGD